MNSSELFDNVTHVSLNQVYQITKVFFFILSFLTYGFFLYFIFNILSVYFTTQHVQENSRYILFAHMLINDTVCLSLSLVLGIVYQFSFIPVPICYFLIAISSATFHVTPYNLAAMALERYIAICYPLQYFMFCTTQRSYMVIGLMWIGGLIPNVVDFVILVKLVPREYFLQSVLCKQQTLLVVPLQNTLKSFTFVGSLLLVALIILFTYVNVLRVAQKSGSSVSSASKAAKTLILHAFQLLLCIVSLASIVTENYGAFMTMANFFIFMCVPRLLSPLIYGIRDEVFRQCIRKMYFLIYKDTTPTIK
ncbi:PREDICTED: olfactory receptor 6S1-like [Nanorana parkeri]|uniref:olfactory receptor 6S1-like n=1 Tax=Nanorana parkeri TaxID=125878 RepID=UPI000853F609|nr:PREDICTED: olfactory receptor 6S1-like [Nanorana parkeri]